MYPSSLLYLGLVRNLTELGCASSYTMYPLLLDLSAYGRVLRSFEKHNNLRRHNASSSVGVISRILHIFSSDMSPSIVYFLSAFVNHSFLDFIDVTLAIEDAKSKVLRVSLLLVLVIGKFGQDFEGEVCSKF